MLLSLDVKTEPESEGLKLFRMLRCGSVHLNPSMVLEETGNGTRKRIWPVLALRISSADDAGFASASTIPTSPFPLAVQFLAKRPSERYRHNSLPSVGFRSTRESRKRPRSRRIIPPESSPDARSKMLLPSRGRP